jgi:hypothetical protein
MSIQMYLIHPKHTEDEEARESIAQFVVQQQGFILMSTSHGSIIAAFDERHLEAMKRHQHVEFASGVMLDPAAPGAAALQQLFAQNVAAQLNERGIGSAAPAKPGAFPPGYRPLRWPAQHGEGER